MYILYISNYWHNILPNEVHGGKGKVGSTGKVQIIFQNKKLLYYQNLAKILIQKFEIIVSHEKMNSF